MHVARTCPTIHFSRTQWYCPANMFISMSTSMSMAMDPNKPTQNKFLLLPSFSYIFSFHILMHAHLFRLWFFFLFHCSLVPAFLSSFADTNRERESNTSHLTYSALLVSLFSIICLSLHSLSTLPTCNVVGNGVISAIGRRTITKIWAHSFAHLEITRMFCRLPIYPKETRGFG